MLLPSKLRNKRGAAMVEMAIVVTLLLLLVFGIIDFGLMLKDYLALSQAAREGARSAAVGTNAAQVSSTINTWASKVGLTPSGHMQQVKLEYVDPASGATSTLGDSGEYNDAPQGSEIVVKLVYRHDFIMGQFLGLGDSISLGTTMVMRRE